MTGVRRHCVHEFRASAMAERVGFEPTVPLRVHDLGRDPAQDRQDEREAPTVADLAERYLAERGPRKAPKTLSEDRSILKRLILPRLGRLKVGHVRVDDVEALHRQLVDTPTMANRTVALISSMMNCAVRWGLRDNNPAREIPRYPEQPRERYLTDEESQRLVEVLDDERNQAVANMIRLMILTGARKNEVLRAEWSETSPACHPDTDSHPPWFPKQVRLGSNSVGPRSQRPEDFKPS